MSANRTLILTTDSDFFRLFKRAEPAPAAPEKPK